MHNPLPAICTSLAVAALALAATPAVAQSDDFNDNTRGSQWSLIQDSAALAIDEANGELQVTATPPGSPINDAIYLSNGPDGFQFSTAADFGVTIDFAVDPSFITPVSPGNSSPTDLGLVFGVGTDPSGFDSAAVGFGIANASGLLGSAASVATRTDDVQTTQTQAIVSALVINSVSGTMSIDYNALLDRLTLSLVLDGNPNPVTSFDFDGVVQDDGPTGWDADTLLVSFGVRGNDFTVQPGGLTLDNFLITAGQPIPIPEPASAAVFALLAGGLVTRRRRRG